MIRRSRISVRPNVRLSVAPRTGPLATPQDGPSQSQATVEAPSGVTEENATAAVVTSQAPGDTADQCSEGTMSSSAVQRRKRLSIKPKVTPTLVRTSSRTPKSPLKAVSESPAEAPCSDQTASCQAESMFSTSIPSPSRRRTSEKSGLPCVPHPTPTAVTAAEQHLELAQQSSETEKNAHCLLFGQAEEVPPKPPDKVRPSLPDKEAMEISERAKTLVSRSAKTELSSSNQKVSLSRLLNDQSDLQRLAKANKLRELLRQEMHKEKAKSKKAKARVKEYTLDHTKMTMKDLIYYLPISNPMSSNLEESAQENETVVPPSPGREEPPEKAQEPEIPPETTNQTHEDVDDDNNEEEQVEEEEEAGEEEDDALMVPRVKVAEDGSLIIDEESLTVQVKRAKGPNLAQDRDPIFERGSTTTYSSFRKGTHTKPWSTEETEMFFLAVSMVGTDFSMICQLFPHRARSEIKNKFKKEERENAWRIDKAFKERRKLDLEFFSKLLEKILEVQRSKKCFRRFSPQKSCSEKKETKPRKTKQCNRKAKENLLSEEVVNAASDVEEEDGGKENEEETSTSPKKKRRKKNEGDLSSKNANEKNLIGNEKSDKQGEANVPEDAEAALPEEDHSTVDGAEKSESVKSANDTRIKPAQLSRGRAPKPLVPVGRRLGKKAPAPTTKPKKDGDTTDATEKNLDEVADEQVGKEEAPLRQAKTQVRVDKDASSEDEDSTVKPSKPTRYGRTPKPVEHLNYPAKEDVPTPASDASASAKPLPQARKAKSSAKTNSKPESKKPKLVTLRASQTESSDEEHEEEMEEQPTPLGSPKDSSAPVFVPASLRSPHPVVSEVEETMEELDILVNVPDVLGVSQDVLCPDASDETGMVSCDHQLDLLADVIDFLSTEHMEVSEKESYTEAAQTLLTIGSLTHLSPSAQMNPPACLPSSDENIVLEPVESSGTSQMTVTSVPTVTEALMTDIIEQDKSTTNSDPSLKIYNNKEETVADKESATQTEAYSEAPEQSAPQTRRGSLPKLKPKPNLGLSARRKTQPVLSPPKTEEDGTALHELPADTQPPSVAEESFSGTALASVAALMPTTDFTLPHPQEPSTSTEESLDAVPGLQVEPGIVSTEESASLDTHCLSQTNLKNDVEQAARNASDSQSTDETVTLSIKTAEDTTNTAEDTTNTSKTLSDVIDSQGSTKIPLAPVQKASEPATCQTTKNRFVKVKPKPNLGRSSSSRVQQSKPGPRNSHVEPVERPKSPASKLHSIDHTVAEVEPQPTCSNAAPENPPADSFSSSVSTCQEKRTGVGAGPHVHTSSESPPKNVTQKRRGRLPKARPNVAASIRSKPAKSTEQPLEDNGKISQHLLSSSDTCPEQHPDEDSYTHSEVKPVFGKHVTSLYSSNDEPCGSGNTLEPENNSNTADVITSGTVVFYENPFVIVETGASDMSPTSASPAVDPAGRQKAEAESAVLKDRDLRSPTETTERNLHSTEDVTPISELKSSGKSSMSKTKLVPSDTSCISKMEVSAQQACSEQSESGLKGHDAQQENIPENVGANPTTTATSQDALNIDNQTKPPDSGQSSTKARRARLPKPKPNLGHRNRLTNLPPVQCTAKPEPDSSNFVEALENQASHGLESKPSSVILQPVEGATSQHNSLFNRANDTVSSPFCMTQRPVTFTEGDTSAVVGGSQSFPFLATNPDDNEEPFFILSLTEIPVFRQEGDSMSEPLPYPPPGAPPVQFQNLRTHGGHQTVAVEGPPPADDRAERDDTRVQDMGPALTSSTAKTAMNPHEDAIIQPSGAAEAIEGCGEVDEPHKKRRVAETRRRAKVQVKPNTAGKRQLGKAFAGKEAESSCVEKQLSAPPLQQESIGAAQHEVLTEPQQEAGAHLDAEKGTSTDGEASMLNRPGRKPKGFLSFLSDKPNATSPGAAGQARAAAPRPQAKPSRSGRKRAAPTPRTTRKPPSEVTRVDSASATDVLAKAPRPTATEAPEQADVAITQTGDVGPLRTDPVAGTSQRPAEVTLQDSLADEPMNVSQYFLSDIFTNMDEG